MALAFRNRPNVTVIERFADFDVQLTKNDACMVLDCTPPTLRKILRAARDHGIESPFKPGPAIREYTTPQDLNKFMKNCAATPGILPSKLMRRYESVVLPPPVIDPADHLLRISQWSRETGVSEQSAHLFIRRAAALGVPSPFKVIAGPAKIKRATRREIEAFVAKAENAGAKFPTPRPRNREEDQE